MAEFKSFREVKKLFRFSIPAMINDIMMGLNDVIIELNQVEQLSEGIDALDQRIKTISAEEQGAGEVYGAFAIQERQAEGLQTENVDLKFTGEFWKTFKIVKVAQGWEIQANFNIHGEDIRDNFDSSYDFTGLTPENLEFLVHQYVLPRLEKRIKERLKI